MRKAVGIACVILMCVAPGAMLLPHLHLRRMAKAALVQNGNEMTSRWSIES